MVPFSSYRRLFVSLIAIILVLMIADMAFPPDMGKIAHASPQVQDKNGVLLRAFLTKDGYWRMQTRVSDVSPRYLAMLKAYEDKRFDRHGGVDPYSLARAALQWASAGHVISGGSTLTMQVARLLEPPKRRGIFTKVFQILRAVQLEVRYSKEQILSFYLTLAPFGGNLEGVNAASLSYFGKPANQIDLAQAALLVALPQSPVKQRPDRHAIAALKGRDKVLKRMVEDGVITAGDAAIARREGVPFARQAMPMRAPHLAERLARSRPETRIVTTIDADIQTAVEELASQEVRYSGDGATMAIVVVENKSRNVIAYLGGTNYWGKAGQLDLTRRPRSPGSALKPFIYGLAFDDLMLHPSTMMDDAPMNFGDYAPRDFSGDFQGQVTARDALRMSLNVPAVAVLEKVGPLAFTLSLQNAGAHLAFPTVDTVPNAAFALGGLGISPLDITMLYAGIANGGEVKPLRLLQNQPEGASHRLFGPVAAYYLYQILTGVSLPEGWAMGEGLARSRTIGFKTGTSYGYRDAWSVGFSHDYTVGVWVGRADGTPRPGHVGVDAAAPILLKVFGVLPADKAPAPTPPTGAILAETTEGLPPSLRVFTRTVAQEVARVAPTPPPSIAYPPNGTVVPLPGPKDTDKTILLKAEGGKAPLTWLVNGMLVGSFDRFQPAQYLPEGEGNARITVVNSQGRSDSALVQFKREK